MIKKTSVFFHNLAINRWCGQIYLSSPGRSRHHRNGNRNSGPIGFFITGLVILAILVFQTINDDSPSEQTIQPNEQVAPVHQQQPQVDDNDFSDGLLRDNSGMPLPDQSKEVRYNEDGMPLPD